MDLRGTIQQYHRSLDEFSRGESAPLKQLYSHHDDVTLANPFGPPVRGWGKVSEALDFASSRFRDGKVTRIETVAEYQGADIATTLETEHWTAKVSGRTELGSFQLRVSNTFRLENGSWRLVHRHADPITTYHPDGPLRPTGA